MAMKSPTQTTNLNVETMMPAVTHVLVESPSHLKETLQLQPLSVKEESKVKTPESTKEHQQVINTSTLLNMIAEPLTKEYTKEPSPPKLGISRSQDDDQYNEEIVEQKFGSVSPIFHTSRSSISSIGASRASNFRLKFRKSHTCGSLFANCNCSSPTSTSAPIPVHANAAAAGSTAQRNPHNASAERTAFIAAPSSFHLSISPSTTETSSMSSSRYTSGIYSLSTQTSSATSAQLSHDESFDFVACGGAPAPLSGSPNEIAVTDNSLTAARQAYSTETETQAQFSNTLQIPRISSPTTETSAPVASARKAADRKPKRLFQSYSHPDTDFIFTDDNKHPSRESLVQIHVQHEQPLIKSRGGKVEIKHPKRSSSPNIGQYQILDVAVHPDILVKISPRHSPISESRRATNSPLSSRSTQQRRRLLQRSHEIDSGGSTTDSEPSFDVKSPTEGQVDVENPLKKLQLQSPTKPSTPVSPVSKTKSTLPAGNSSTSSLSSAAEESNFNAAQKYFAESGILGPINTSTNLIRKTSKILQDSNVIEQIRRTSMILRGNSTNNSNNNTKKTSTVNQPTTPTCGTKATSPVPPLKLKFLNNASMEVPATVMYASSPASPKSPHTMATSCGFSPNMTSQSCSVTDDRDAQIKSLQGEIVSLKDVIKSRDAEIVKLRREIHKLKSVLQQTTNHLPIASDDLLQSPPAALANRCFMPPQCTEISSTNQPQQQQQQICHSCKKKFELEKATGAISSVERLTPDSNGSIDSIISDNYQSCTSLTTCIGTTTAVACALTAADEKPEKEHDAEIALDAVAQTASDSLACNGVKSKLIQMVQAPVLKKQGVSGESCETSMQQSINVPIPKFDKDFSSKQLIKDAIMDNDFLKNIDASQVRELVESMYSLSVAKGEFVIREGEAGAHLYVSAEGEFEVVKNGKVLGIMGPGKAFGELAILYNCTRTASIRVLSHARVWVLDRRVFQQIMMRTGLQRIENSVNFLKSVPLLKNLSDEVLAKIADVLEVEFYPAGTYIIRQGATGDTFFLISQGSVKVTQKLSPSTEEKEIRTLERGDYFGEQALINEDKRTANIIAMAPGVECLTLDRDSFTHLIGDLCELKEKNYGDEHRVLAMKYSEKTKEIFGSNVQQEFPNMSLTDLEVVATLGIGGFGRVELVKAYQENRVDTFALKCLKKRHIVDTKQEEHVFSERTIMLTCNTPFICRLHRTFRDEKYVYMLLEACMGGEIWTMLRDRGSFDENATQFIIGCVLQAFEYLHSRGIIYRDLKPENLMLDERGYVKLVDFGFAKYIGNSSKTWTFCGTPEYVAPEIILNKGHDRAVDYWALGILIHELLNGTPPFTANDPMKTYNIILKGIDMIDFPKHMSRSAVQLIKKLCRDVPAERLGYQKGGIQDIKKHKWFLGFDWDGLESQLLIPPFVRPIAHPTDTCYFDRFPCDPNETPDELTGWDADF